MNTASMTVRRGNTMRLVGVVAGESNIELNAANNCFIMLSQDTQRSESAGGINSIQWLVI